jgi:hypothetical protein
VKCCLKIQQEKTIGAREAVRIFELSLKAERMTVYPVKCKGKQEEEKLHGLSP